MAFNPLSIKPNEIPKSEVPEKKAENPDKVNQEFSEITEKFNNLFKDDLLNENNDEQSNGENHSSDVNNNTEEYQDVHESGENKGKNINSMFNELFPDDINDTSDVAGEVDIEKNNPILEKIEKSLGTPEGIKELIKKHPEKAELWQYELKALDILNDPEATPLQSRSAVNKLNVLKGQLLENAVKDELSDTGFDVETEQRVVEGESGGTRPDVIAENNTDKPIEVFGEKIQLGETISVECKCGRSSYLTDQLRNHIPNQLSGQIGTKVLLTTSDIHDVPPGLAEGICEKYGANLTVLNISVADVESAIKEVAS